MNTAGDSDFLVHQEDDVVATRTITLVVLVTIVIGTVAVLVSGIMLKAVIGSLEPSAAGAAGTKPTPRDISDLEQASIVDTEEGIDLRGRQKADLNRYRWIQRDAGIAAMPIDRAIDRVVEEAR
jgi:hypothetical protein